MSSDNDKVKLIDVLPENKMLWFKDICIMEDKMWAIAGNYNGLYELALEHADIRYLGSFQGENIFDSQLYSRLFYYSNMLIAIPSYADSIGIFDLSKCKFEQVKLPKIRYSYRQDCKFGNACIHNGKIFMFPEYYPCIMEFDIESRKIIMHDEWYRDYLGYGEMKSSLIFSKDMVVVQDKAYLVSSQCNIIMQFNMKTGAYLFHRVGWGILTTLACDGSFFWSTNTEGMLFKWSLDNFEKIEEILLDTESEFFIYSDILYPHLVLIPSQMNEIVYYDVECNEIQRRAFEEDKDKTYAGYEYHRFFFAKKISPNQMLVQDRKDRSIKMVYSNGLKNWCPALKDEMMLTQKEFDRSEYYQSVLNYNKKQLIDMDGNRCDVETKWFGLSDFISCLLVDEK